jgi:hypothetical protein
LTVESAPPVTLVQQSLLSKLFGGVDKHHFGLGLAGLWLLLHN